MNLRKVLINRIRMTLWNLLINQLAGSHIIPPELRVIIYKLLGMNINSRFIMQKCFFRSNKFKIGKWSWVNNECFFDNEDSDIEIGNNCGIGMQVLFCTSSHEIGNFSRRASTNIKLPIRVEDGCWIGARASIMPGVTIGRGCVVAAGSIVTKDCEPNGLYAGVPAKRIKELLVETD